MRLTYGLPLAVGVALLLPTASSSLRAAAGKPEGPANRILARELGLERSEGPFALQAQRANKDLPHVSGGVMRAVREAMAGLSGNGGKAAGALAAENAQDTDNGETRTTPPSAFSNGCPNVFKGDDDDHGPPDNIRVNQDCTLRFQAEEAVAVNPRDFRNVVAGQNDGRIGFNHCGYDWSLSRGQTWGDTGTAPPPFWGVFLDDFHTGDACSDPSATFDHLGNAYVSGVVFDAFSPPNAIFVQKSNAPFKGRLYHSPRQQAFQEYRTSPVGRPASDVDPDVFNDKPLMIADSRPASPKKGRVYVTWTRFQATPTPVGVRSPIVFSQSLDGGDHWSRAVIISGAAGSFCTSFSGTEGQLNACDQDQGSDPVVGPDGTIYVIFFNGNTPLLGINQVLMVRCPATANCDVEADWQGPFRVGDAITTHPVGDPGNAGGCGTGNQCLPPNGYRAPDETFSSISVDQNSNLYATWADHRNSDANCGLIPWSTARPPCDHDVFYAFSTSRGTVWSPTIDVTPRARLGNTAQWQPWNDVMGDGSQVQVAFYDRHYGDCEFSGCNDITLATISNPRSASRRISYRRITTASMPNLVPANNPLQAGFLGDYMQVEVSRHNFEQRATHIVWADTRQLWGRAPEEDIYYARVGGDKDDGNGEDDDDGHGEGHGRGHK